MKKKKIENKGCIECEKKFKKILSTCDICKVKGENEVDFYSGIYSTFFIGTVYEKGLARTTHPRWVNEELDLCAGCHKGSMDMVIKTKNYADGSDDGFGFWEYGKIKFYE